MPALFFGLDGEMSAAELTHGGRLIQVGVVAHSDRTGQVPSDGSELFSAVLRPSEFMWDQEAEAVHGLTREEVMDAAPAAQVDAELRAWLLEHGAQDGEQSAIAIGFNVGTFDLPHLAAVLPRSASLFSHRSVELNAICFTLDGVPYAGRPTGWQGWKQAAVRWAVAEIAGLDGGENAAHDAGFDARLHLFVWRFLRAAVAGRPFPQPDMVFTEPESQILAQTLISTFGSAQAAQLSGVPEQFLLGWSIGGRATRGDYLEALRMLVDDQGLNRL